jgi:hypothetical protein
VRQPQPFDGQHRATAAHELMKSVNLIPGPRLAAKRRRVHLRRCVAGCCAWAVLAAGAAGAAQVTWGGVDPGTDASLEKLARDIDDAGRATGAVNAELSAAESTLRAKRRIADQPDWSLLLAILAGQTGDEVVLKGCNLRVAATPAPTPPVLPARPGAGQVPVAAGALQPTAHRFTVNASGVAKSQLAVTKFVLRLEQTGLFARVTLLDTTREAFVDGEAIGFRVECWLDEPGVVR